MVYISRGNVSISCMGENICLLSWVFSLSTNIRLGRKKTFGKTENELGKYSVEGVEALE
jgi:hypothetical protein